MFLQVFDRGVQLRIAAILDLLLRHIPGVLIVGGQQGSIGGLVHDNVRVNAAIADKVPLGVSHSCVPSKMAEPSESLYCWSTVPVPKVFELPIMIARWLSCSAPDTISAALAEFSLTSTTIGMLASRGSPLTAMGVRCPELSCSRSTFPLLTNRLVVSSASLR